MINLHLGDSNTKQVKYLSNSILRGKILSLYIIFFFYKINKFNIQYIFQI